MNQLSLNNQIVYDLGRLLSIPGEAVFSTDKLYRYTLTRTWGNSDKVINFLMTNPSIATEFILDPTVKRCLKWAILWGYSKLIVTNLFAYRSTDLSQIYKVTDPIGPNNDNYIIDIFNQVSTIVCAWGTSGKYLGRGDKIKDIADKLGKKLYYLRLTKNQHPQHPLYLPNSVEPILWRN